VKLAIEFIASVLVVGLVWIYFGVAFAYGDSGGEVPTPVTVACAGVVAAIGFAAAIMTHHFPWVALLVSSVGIVAFFSLTGASPVGLALTGCAALAFGGGATLAILWKRSKRSASTEHEKPR
jgi:hypothetical protein